MSAEEMFDAIVVGAGPAGIACACALAKEGREVVLIERGSAAGEKNYTGGRIYSHALELLEPGLVQQAAEAGALERKVLHEQIMCLSEHGAMTVDYQSADPLPARRNGQKVGDNVAQSWTVLHSRFNNWFASKAEEAGVMVACGVRVDKLIEKDGAIVGVQAGGDEMFAKVVVAADGVNSFLAAEAGLAPKLDSHAVGVGIKEVISLPESVIEDRFLLDSDTGASRVVLGCTAGIPGGGAIYTNKNSISLACVFNPADLAKQNVPAPELFQRYKMHPAIHALIKGGETVEYGGHLVMENGWRNVMQKPYRNGLLVAGEAAGYVINTGVIIRGIDLAILSGLSAAKAILTGSTGSGLGEEYVRQLEACKLNDAMRATSKWPDFMASPRLFADYPNLAVDGLSQLFAVDDQAASLGKRLFGTARAHLSIKGMITDGWKAVRAL